MKAVFLDFGTYYPEGLDASALEAAFEDFTFYDRTEPEDVLERVQGAEVILTNKVVISRDIIAACPDLKFIVEGATGYNNIDVEAAREHGVTVCNVRGYSTPAVAQHTFTLMLILRTQMFQYYQDVKSDRWQECRDFCFLDYRIDELAGQTLGIIGYGDLGRKVEQIARAFDMNVLIADHKGLDETQVREGRVTFDRVIEEADVITLHCPLTDKTKDLITMDEMRVMDDNAIIINTARGGIVNEADLAQALRDGVIGGAGVDVLSKEPPSEGNPLLDPTIPNLVMSPHTAWASLQARQRMFDQIVDVINAYRAGSPINVVS